MYLCVTRLFRELFHKIKTLIKERGLTFGAGSAPGAETTSFRRTAQETSSARHGSNKIRQITQKKSTRFERPKS